MKFKLSLPKNSPNSSKHFNPSLLKIAIKTFLCVFILIEMATAKSLIKNSIETTKAKRIIILGDSLTEGYGVSQEAAFPSLLQKKIKEENLPWTLTASGSSGSTTASVLSRLKWIAKDKPDVVLILMGSNDGLRGLKIEETEKNLEQALVWAQQNKIKIFLGQLYVPPNYGKDYFKKFSAVFPRLSKKNNVPLAPFLLENVAGLPEMNLADGIHPNEKGHKIVANNIFSFLKLEVPNYESNYFRFI